MNNWYAAAYTPAPGLMCWWAKRKCAVIWLREFRDGLAALVASDPLDGPVSPRQTSSTHGAIRTTQMCVTAGGVTNRQGEYTGGYRRQPR